MSVMTRCLCGMLLFGALVLSPSIPAASVLANSQWRIELDPATLALRVIPAQHWAVQVSVGVPVHKVSGLRQRDNRLDWQWDEGAWTLSAVLDNRDLLLSIAARGPGFLTFLEQPASALGRGLIWPLAEGHYVPTGDSVWQRFLLDQGELNTTQDLSLPLWGVDHGSFTLNWLLTNPYNNRIAFSAQDNGLALLARHQFTALEPGRVLTFRLSLGDADLLAGAKRYRQWLVDNGQYQTLSDKLLNMPEGQKLLGASHVYLWGNDLLGPGDVRRWPILLSALRGNGTLARELRATFDGESTQLLAQATLQPDRYQRALLLRNLNTALNKQARKTWQSAAEPDMHVLAAGYGALRSALAVEFSDALTAGPQHWGDTLSVATIKQLNAAGLSRLWLGLGEGWEGGLWHPEAVRLGVANGYLVAPYDSYETALDPTENTDWVTAHLGAAAHRDCAIVLQNGALQRGFQQSGHYTDPRCVRPLLEARVMAIQRIVGFNSWFLDVYAAGMLFDNYRAGATMTQVANASANVDASRWISETLKLPTGSEDGNASTAQGILFAHGMQTPVIGWGDVDMNSNQHSPYYVGAWFPNEQPQVFFKSVPLKEPFRSLHFAPQTRLPLYQAVFHGSVITSHHWQFDSLKLSNVRVENELAQLLYNVPPLYHLSAATLEQRLPLMVRQDGFFRPLHERLATQALTDFRWLTVDRLVQQTTFADGTRMLANFDSRAREVEGIRLAAQSLAAIGADGSLTVHEVSPPP